MDEVKNDLITLKQYLTSLKETVSQLSGDLEKHKSWTKSQLADLQSSIDNPPTERMSDAVLLKLQPYIEESLMTNLSSVINDRSDELVSSLHEELKSLRKCLNETLSQVSEDLEEQKNQMTSLKECFNETLSQLSKDPEEHKNRTTLELADLQSSIDNPPTERMSDAVLLKLQPYIEESLMTNLSSVINDRSDELVSSLHEELKSLRKCLNETLSQVSEDLEEQKNQMTSLKECFNETLSQLSVDLEEHKKRTTLELADLQSSLQSSISTTHNEQKTQLSDGIVMLDTKLVILLTFLSLVVIYRCSLYMASTFRS